MWASLRNFILRKRKGAVLTVPFLLHCFILSCFKVGYELKRTKYNLYEKAISLLLINTYQDLDAVFKPSKWIRGSTEEMLSLQGGMMQSSTLCKKSNGIITLNNSIEKSG